MQLRELTLTNFKNIADAHLQFSAKVNCLVGDNGMGKSNLLDAIHYLSFCRSFSGMADSQLVMSGEQFLMARALYDRRGTDEELTLGISPGRRKSLKRGGKEYKRLTEHIGLFPLVMSSPSDTDLINGPGEVRRRWIDMVISQDDPIYLDALSRYGHALEQRNRLLRDHVVDHTLYDALEIAMDMAAEVIYSRRSERIAELEAVFVRYNALISGSDRQATLTYQSSLSAANGLKSLLDSARRRDEMLGHTTVGPHRDDIEMGLGTMPMRRAGSQGECKTYTIALRMAQFEYLRSRMPVTPLLLLDDIFDKLDAGRVEKIMEIVAGDGFGQIFITDTNRKHLDQIIARTTGSHAMWTVSHGRFTSAGL